LELLETFVQIVKYKQISKAAESLFITQAAASNRLRKLESQLGVKLINRIKGQSTISTTPYGDRLLVLAQQLISLSHEAETLKENAEHTKINIASTTNMNDAVLSFVLPQVMRDDPLLRFNLQSASTFQVYESVNDHQADIGLSFTDAPRYGLNTRQIGKQSLVLVAQKDSPLPNQVDIETLSMKDEIFISYNESYAQWHMICWGDQVDPFISLDSCALISQYMRRSNSWAIIPDSIAQLYITHGFPLKKIRLIEPIPALPIVAVENLSSPYKKQIENVILKLRSFLV
jgi:DNA-binding transcriptional LysR family regulator